MEGLFVLGQFAEGRKRRINGNMESSHEEVGVFVNDTLLTGRPESQKVATEAINGIKTKLQRMVDALVPAAGVGVAAATGVLVAANWVAIVGTLTAWTTAIAGWGFAWITVGSILATIGTTIAAAGAAVGAVLFSAPVAVGIAVTLGLTAAFYTYNNMHGGEVHYSNMRGGAVLDDGGRPFATSFASATLHGQHSQSSSGTSATP